MNELIATPDDIQALHEATQKAITDTDAPLSPWLNGSLSGVRYAYQVENDRINPIIRDSMGAINQEGAAITWELDIVLNTNLNAANSLGYTSLYSVVWYAERPSGVLVQRRCWAEMDKRDNDNPTFNWQLDAGRIGPSEAGRPAFHEAYQSGFESPQARAYVDSLIKTDPDYALIMAGHIAQACGISEPEEPYDGLIGELLTEHPARPVRATECQQLTKLVSTLTLHDQVGRTIS